ncbi:MAG: hypothetical protein COW65_09965 [Cytophagales bacterium CG18_big_fil_WC_8_21_14_2_50_42_9]|nr:MAG: hypothetical protein COW65_09965 [Cytophagales bacterium CG18_big_fil_WC_8_21_14_2_50_42_9]
MAKPIRKSKTPSVSEEVLQMITKNKEALDSSLDLSSMHMDELPDEIWELTHLNELLLRYLNLKVISPKIKKLNNLTILNLNGNKIKSLPSEIGFLTKLRYLDLDNNKLIELPEETSNLLELHHISLQNNRIKKFPDCLTKIKNLNCIHLLNNLIENIPVEIENLSKLQNLALKNNNVKTLPIPFPYLKKIKILDLSSNNISQLPNDIGKLSTLVNFDISSNNINALPTSITKLKKLTYFLYHSLPLAEMPEIKKMGMVEAFRHLELLGSIGENSAFWKVPKPLVTAFKQYLTYFGDFVRTIEQEEIAFEVLSTDDGLKIITHPTLKLSIERIDALLEVYVSQRDFIPGEGLTKEQQFNSRQLIRDYEFQLSQLNAQISNQADKMQLLGDRILSKDELIEALQLKIQFFTSNSPQILQLVPQVNTQKIEVVVQLLPPVQSINQIDLPFDPEKLLDDIFECLKTQCGRKLSHKEEDLHNDNLTDLLRAKGYNITDQTRHGGSKKKAGELDLMVRNNSGSSLAIIEGFKAASAGSKDTNISSHINKLLQKHGYDPAGHEVNFIIVYAEAANFKKFWESYREYMDDLNNKPDFDNTYELKHFRDTGRGKLANIRVGKAMHDREGKEVLIYHIVADMHCLPAKNVASQKKPVPKDAK